MNINNNFVRVADFDNETIKEIPLFERDQSATWTGRMVACLNRLDENLDYYFPDNFAQKKVEALGEQIKETFAPLEEFNEWLNANDYEDFYTHLACALVKLPLRSARNIIDQLYQTVTSVLYFGVHPMKGMNHVLKETVRLFDALTDPKVWPHMGASTLGIGIGMNLAIGNPISLAGIAIGGAMILGGVSLDSFLQIFKAEHGEESEFLIHRFKEHLTQLPETVMTGIFKGLLLGGIQRAMEPKAKPVDVVEEPDEFHILPVDEPDTPINIGDLDDSKIIPIDKPDAPIDLPNDNKTPTINWVGQSAEYGFSGWEGHIQTIPNSTLESAKEWAINHPEVDYFFVVNNYIPLMGDVTRDLYAGDAVFFHGEPWWGDATPWANGYVVER